MIFIDTETCGLHGMAILIQYAEDDGEIILHEVWQNSVQSTLDLIEWFCTKDLCFFNAAFDWFHLCKIYTTFSLIKDKDIWPEDIIDEIAELEEQAKNVDICLKPKSCIDLFLHAQKGPFQSLMSRKKGQDKKDIFIKRVPTVLAEFLKNELNKLIILDDIFFAGRAKEREQWQIDDIRDSNGNINPAFKTISLRFAPSIALKAVAKYVLKTEATKFKEIELNKRYNPVELGYAPYAKAIGNKEDWKWAWPQVIKYHIEHWSYNPEARKYAKDDINHTRNLYKYFKCPESDNDSMLACAVAATRWRGFKVDIEKLKPLRDKAKKAMGKIPTAPGDAKRWLFSAMDEEEVSILEKEGTKAEVLEKIQTWTTPCEYCINGFIIKANKDCKICNGSGLTLELKDCDCVEKIKCHHCKGESHPAAEIAKKIIAARKAQKEVELFDKLIEAGRFHASFKVIGTFSGRMSGADGLNPQAIKGTEEVRDCFPLAFDNEYLCGGDFSALEVGITAAICKDEGLIHDLTVPVKCKCEGKNKKCEACKGKGEYLKKIHALFAEALYPELSYLDILKTQHTEDDKYLKAKSAVFARIYFGEPETIATSSGITVEHSTKACELFDRKYPKIKEFRDEYYKRFGAMSQPKGIGSAIFWKDPEEYSTSLLGFKRYFTIENQIQKKLFDLAQNPPETWKRFRVKVTRRDRVQTASGAAQSAIFAAAFTIESKRIRQAGNHIIQSTGAEITKLVQGAIMKLQPCGIHPWKVRCLNVHDEVQVVTDSKETRKKVSEVVQKEVEKYRHVVPLLKMAWSEELDSWAEK